MSAEGQEARCMTIRKFGTIFFVNLAILAFLVLGFGREYLRNRAIERSIAEMEVENAELEGRKLASMSVIESLSSEYYLEGEARRKHDFAKPGEELVIIDDGVDASATISAQDDDTVEASTLMRWWLYFFDHAAFEELRTL